MRHRLARFQASRHLAAAPSTARRPLPPTTCFQTSFSLAHSSASAGAGLRSTMGFQTLESSALMGIQSRCAGGTSSSAKIASTGHSGTHSVQSMHSSGSITSMLGPSRKQSTGHTSTQSVYLHLMQLSVTTYAMVRTTPPCLSASLAFRENSGISYHAGCWALPFCPEKIAPYAEREPAFPGREFPLA